MDGEFIRDYLITLIKGIRVVGRRWGGDNLIFLPYNGGDLDCVMRLFKGYVRLQFPEFQIDKLNTSIIEYLANIAIGSADRKGLIIRGEVGVGKTTLLKIWLKFRLTILAPNIAELPIRRDDVNDRVMKVSFLDPISLLSAFTKSGYGLFEEKTGDILVVDDLGISTDINHFGTIVNVLEQLILSRYNEFKNSPNLEFYGTTNLTSDQLTQLIGERAKSRLTEMTAWKEGLILGNDRRKDKRKLNVWPKI